MYNSYKDKARLMFDGVMEIILSDIEKTMDELEILESLVEDIEDDVLREKIRVQIGKVYTVLNRISI